MLKNPRNEGIPKTWSKIIARILLPFSYAKIGILLPKLFWPTVRKKCSSDQEKLFKFDAEGRFFKKFFEITRTIYSNSERSEQWLVFT